MFTGLVDSIGTIESVAATEAGLELYVRCTYSDLVDGESVSVNGVCLTVRTSSAGGFTAAAMIMTVGRTTVGDWKAGQRINLERAMKADMRFGGHIVQGHVDGCGEMLALDPVISPGSSAFNKETTDWTLRVRVPDNSRQWMVQKGSVAIEGISLTIAGIEDDSIIIAILPLTYWRTNLHSLATGAPLNVEADVLVKLAAQQLAVKKSELDLTEDWLVASGY